MHAADTAPTSTAPVAAPRRTATWSPTPVPASRGPSSPSR